MKVYALKHNNFVVALFREEENAIVSALEYYVTEAKQYYTTTFDFLEDLRYNQTKGVNLKIEIMEVF